MTTYSQWFVAEGWILISALGFGLGSLIGLKANWVIFPLVLLAIFGIWSVA